jgi:hypothetical protein
MNLYPTKSLAAAALVWFAEAFAKPDAVLALPEEMATSVQNSTVESSVKLRDLDVRGGEARVGSVNVGKAKLRNATVRLQVTADTLKTDDACVDVGSVSIGEPRLSLFEKLMIKNRARAFADNDGCTRSGKKLYIYQDDQQVRQQIQAAERTRAGETRVSIASPVISGKSKVEEVNIVVETRQSVRVK